MNTILLSNLIKIRWIAIFGQLLTILLVNYFLNISILIPECLFVVFLSILVNVFSYFIQKKNNKISDSQAFFFLLFDTSQLGILLFLTGGIFNPFAILILAPVIISASYLPVFWTIFLSIFSIVLILIINFNFIPLNLNQQLFIPDIYNHGLITALIITIIFTAVYAYLFANSSRKISQALSETKVQLSNQKKITEIGSLSAAAVHELSTPLNTIFLILNDLLKEKILIKDKNLLKDVELLKSQAERCKEILLKLSKNPHNLRDNFFEKIKIVDIIKLNFEKFNTNKKLIISNLIKGEDARIFFKDEIMYAIGNIIQNSIIYSKTLVSVEIKILYNELIIIITDDGDGFSREIIDKLGEPYVSKNKKGMGIGIFIAKNLIENMKGSVFFHNSKENNAVVEIKFNKSILCV
tara:strand:+ start:1749 stop:2978 length:1230 start_codon:yes stop_codon:yes gene_type:complete